MDYQNTFSNLMKNLNNRGSYASGVVSETPVENSTTTTVYEDFKLTVTNEILTNAGLNNAQRLVVYISNNQNAVYLTNKNSLGNEFSVSKILKHTPNMGIRLNIGKVLNIGSIPSEMSVQVQNGMVKIYPKDGINKLPADKAFEEVCKTIEKVYGFPIHQFLSRLHNGVI